jgi:hypothetical protein
VVPVDTSFAQRRELLQEQIDEARSRIEAVESKLGQVNCALAQRSEQSEQYQLLENVCDSLDRLSALGASSLFWGQLDGDADPDKQLRGIREGVAKFRDEIARIEQMRSPLLSGIRNERAKIDALNEELAEVDYEEENAKYEFVVEREVRTTPFRPSVMPWARQGEDQKRFRKVLLACLLFMFLLGALPQIWVFPPSEKKKIVKVPERIAKLVKKKVPPKPPQKTVNKPELKKPEEKKAEEHKKPEKKEVEHKKAPKPTPKQVRQARAKASKTGVLAFKNSFADLMNDDVTPSKLGADAKIRKSGEKAVGGAPGSRSIITTQSTKGSGGIASTHISRGGVGNASGGAITRSGVNIARAESGIGVDMKGSDRPLSDGVGPARTDEEIQIVFDRHKAALYRIYNRELRKDPTLRGKMVLALTIEPDGRVSFCEVKSTDMKSPELSKRIVRRVKMFNFGAKKGVPVTKILYPIDFLPAS